MSDAQPHNPPAPGPAHAVLAADAGVWDTEVEVTPAPGAPPQRSRGVSENRMTCGGLWLVTDYRNESGFEGHGVYGWDPVRGKYVGTWVDVMRQFLVVGEGSWDPERRAMTFSWEAPGPGGKPMRWREVTEKPDDATRVFRSLFPTPSGAEFELMRINYRKRA